MTTILGTIELRGLRVMGYCGVLPFEQERTQPLEVDLDVVTDISAAAATDDLTETVDYGGLCATVVELVSTGRYQLLERLAAEIGDAVLADPRVDAVEVAVRKLRPPVQHHLATSGVRLRRVRS